jgi:hypothetical protein
MWQGGRIVMVVLVGRCSGVVDGDMASLWVEQGVGWTAKQKGVSRACESKHRLLLEMVGLAIIAY